MQRLIVLMGFSKGLVVSMAVLVLTSILIVASLVFIQYRSSFTQAVMEELESSGQMNSQLFTQWLQERQQEMRFLARLDAALEMDPGALTPLLVSMAHTGYYDTIIVVNPQGEGIAGTAYENAARPLSRRELEDFRVPDRDWFRSAIQGSPVFSRPLVSRATGNLVSTVAIPIRRDGQIVGVMRGAVSLQTIMRQVEGLATSKEVEIFLINGQNGLPLTPAASIQRMEAPLDTLAGHAIRQGLTGVALYDNARREAVIGSYTHISLLDWGLVLEEPVSSALAEVRQMFTKILVIALIMVTVAMVISLAIARAVNRILGGEPLYAAQVVQQVADGNLAVSVALREGDKTSLLAAISSMQCKLHKIMERIGNYANEVAAAAAELSQINDATDQGVQQQSLQMDSAAIAMNQMTTTVDDVARNTQEAADNVQETLGEVRKGKEVVGSTITAIEILAGNVSRTAEAMDALRGDTESIGSILQVIRDVAEQTNLLALNAAIEAARAGEQGRGFAVVADEVRTLASRTQKSTTDIQSMIERLQTSARSAVEVMEESRQGASRSVEQAVEAGSTLDRITQSVLSINGMTQQIASATEEQSTTVRDISQSICRINEVSQQTRDNISNTTKASDSLARLAEELRVLVGHFQT